MIKIDGNWKAGYAIDLHTISSVYLGDNLDGQPQFTLQSSQSKKCLCPDHDKNKK